MNCKTDVIAELQLTVVIQIKNKLMSAKIKQSYLKVKQLQRTS